jgi:phenylacetic acid degradation operon negative regulatory protein
MAEIRPSDGTGDDVGSFPLAPQRSTLGLLGEYTKPGDAVWARGLVSLLHDLGFSRGSARIALNRIVARELLDRSPDGRLAFYTATPRLLERLDEGGQQTYYFRRQPQNADLWTLV